MSLFGELFGAGSGPLERATPLEPVLKVIRRSLTSNVGAGNGVRTRDPQLGKLMLYQLSYARSVAEI